MSTTPLYQSRLGRYHQKTGIISILREQAGLGFGASLSIKIATYKTTWISPYFTKYLFIYLFIYLRTQHSKQYKIEDTIKAVKF